MLLLPTSLYIKLLSAILLPHSLGYVVHYLFPLSIVTKRISRDRLYPFIFYNDYQRPFAVSASGDLGPEIAFMTGSGM